MILPVERVAENDKGAQRSGALGAPGPGSRVPGPGVRGPGAGSRVPGPGARGPEPRAPDPGTDTQRPTQIQRRPSHIYALCCALTVMHTGTQPQT